MPLLHGQLQDRILTTHSRGQRVKLFPGLEKPETAPLLPAQLLLLQASGKSLPLEATLLLNTRGRIGSPSPCTPPPTSPLGLQRIAGGDGCDLIKTADPTLSWILSLHPRPSPLLHHPLRPARLPLWSWASPTHTGPPACLWCWLRVRGGAQPEGRWLQRQVGGRVASHWLPQGPMPCGQVYFPSLCLCPCMCARTRTCTRLANIYLGWGSPCCMCNQFAYPLGI